MSDSTHPYSSRAFTALIVFLSLAGCGERTTPETGDLELSVAANEAVRVGFPHEENGQLLEFVDGWSFQVEVFAVTIGAVTLREPTEQGQGPVIDAWRGPVVVDMASEEDGDVALGRIEELPARRLDLGFDLIQATAEADVLGLSTQDAERMRQLGWSMLIRGTATPSPDHPMYREPVQIDLGLSAQASYYACVNGKDGTEGIAIEANTVTSAYIYPHLVHLFWDTLGAGDEDLRFDPMAAAAGPDRVLTIEELEAVDLTGVLGEDGLPLYDDSGLLERYTMRAFVERAMLESMHLNGIGFCKKSLLE